MHSDLWGRTPQQHSTMARLRGRCVLHASAARRRLWLEEMREQVDLQSHLVGTRTIVPVGGMVSGGGWEAEAVAVWQELNPFGVSIVGDVAMVGDVA